MTYSEKLKDPRWQRKRLEIMGRDNFHCMYCGCGKETLNVHHAYYEKGKDPWDYPDKCFLTLCQSCHQGTEETKNKVLAAMIHPVMLEAFAIFAHDANACIAYECAMAFSETRYYDGVSDEKWDEGRKRCLENVIGQASGRLSVANGGYFDSGDFFGEVDDRTKLKKEAQNGG